MNRYTRKWAPIRCGSRCDPKACFVQFPAGDFYPEEARLCPGPAVGKPCGLHPSRRAQDHCPDPWQTRFGQRNPSPNYEGCGTYFRRHDEGVTLAGAERSSALQHAALALVTPTHRRHFPPGELRFLTRSTYRRDKLFVDRRAALCASPPAFRVGRGSHGKSVLRFAVGSSRSNVLQGRNPSKKPTTRRTLVVATSSHKDAPYGFRASRDAPPHIPR